MADSTKLQKYKVAAVQASPIFFDSHATALKTVEYIKEAAAGGAKLVVFPELWLPGYPFWLWLYSYPVVVQRGYVESYQANSVMADGPESEMIREACRTFSITATLGVSEKEHGTLYMSQWIIGPDGAFISRRRKLKPSIVERLLFGEGDGSDIKVHDTPLGRLGALQCWEHTQPLLKYAMAAQHEQVHAASWPHFGPALPHHSLSMEANHASNISYAVEVGTFNIVSTAPISSQNQDVLVDGDDSLRAVMPLGGGMTFVLDPEGRQISSRPAPEDETIVFAEVDLAKTFLARAALNTVGHYARNDVFRVHFDPTPRQHIHVGPHGAASTARSERVGREQLFEVMAAPRSDFAVAEVAEGFRPL